MFMHHVLWYSLSILSAIVSDNNAHAKIYTDSEADLVISCIHVLYSNPKKSLRHWAPAAAQEKWSNLAMGFLIATLYDLNKSF